MAKNSEKTTPGFLDLNKSSDCETFDRIIEGHIDMQRCRFEGDETACPMFRLADEPANDHECATQAWRGFKSFCELLPDFGRQNMQKEG